MSVGVLKDNLILSSDLIGHSKDFLNLMFQI